MKTKRRTRHKGSKTRLAKHKKAMDKMQKIEPERITHANGEKFLDHKIERFVEDEGEFPGLTIKQRVFLAAYSEVGNCRDACKIAHVAYGTHRRWLTGKSKYDPNRIPDEERARIYREAFAVAQEQAAEMLEAEARRRAVVGVKRFRFYKGEPIIDPETKKPYFELEYSDPLLILLLKAARPEKYRERHDISGETTVKGSMNTQIDARVLLAKLPVKLRKELLTHLTADQEQKLLPPPSSSVNLDDESEVDTEEDEEDQEEDD